ncbi:MAG: hypothetical protein Q4F21_11315 [Lachnospiraceae bacterium]|nr:hypothetical protein [Lachnospiraceae bacterium]
MSEMKPRSMRMSDENYARLQSLSEGRSLDETIRALLSAHDKDEERNNLGGQAVKLDELDEFLNAIRSQFAALLHISQNAKEVVRTEYRKELDEKNAAIAAMKDEIVKLQNQVMKKDASAQETIEQLRGQLEDSRKKSQNLENSAAEASKIAEQKQQLIDSLSSALSSAEQKAIRLKESEKALADANAALKEAYAEYENLTKEHKKLQNRAEEVESLYQQQRERQQKAFEECKADCKTSLARAKSVFDEQSAQLKAKYELELKTVRAEADFSIREARIQAQSQVNEIKEEYQNKLFEFMAQKKADLQKSDS